MKKGVACFYFSQTDLQAKFNCPLLIYVIANTQLELKKIRVIQMFPNVSLELLWFD